MALVHTHSLVQEHTSTRRTHTQTLKVHQMHDNAESDWRWAW